MIATIGLTVGCGGSGAPSATELASTSSPAASPTGSGEVPRFQLGVELEPGTYQSEVFVSPLEFTVTAGWKVFEDEPGQFGLALIENDGPCVCIWRDVRVAAATVGQEEPDPAVGATAADITAALAGRPGIDATTPAAATVGGLQGYLIDLRLAAGTEGAPTVIGTQTSAGVYWGVAPGSEQRLVVLDVPADQGGGNVAINIEVCCGVTFADRTAVVDPVIASFRFLP